jgi:hypothetical protein
MRTPSPQKQASPSPAMLHGRDKQHHFYGITRSRSGWDPFARHVQGFQIVNSISLPQEVKNARFTSTKAFTFCFVSIV